MFVLIPAYQPGPALVTLVQALQHARPALTVLVVDDGSSAEHAPVFAAAACAGARVLHLPVNRGKGFALKAGFAQLAELGAAEPVVTADADGQHAPADILRVLDAVDSERPDHLVLGARVFGADVPLRSRVGNSATRLLFRLATGRALQDTQSGLRAFPAALLPWLGTLRGDRYEYELVMLLEAARRRIDVRTVPIATIYLDDNSSSHFRPVADSVRIYGPLLVFLGSSLLAFTVDTAALLLLSSVLGSLFLAVVGARLASATVNFVANRRLVFDRSRTSRTGRAARRYAALAATLLTLNYLILVTLVQEGVATLPAKLVTELVLVAVSYAVQARFVFAPSEPAGMPERPEVLHRS